MNDEREKSNPKEMEFDELLTDHVGEFGCFQWFVIVVFCYEWIMSGFVALSPVFVAGVPDHWCDISDNSTSATCTSQEIKENLLPQEGRDGKIQHSQCKRYDFLVNNTSPGCGKINSSDYIIADCNKWAYDDNLIDETIVTEVRINILQHLKRLSAVSGIQIALHNFRYFVMFFVFLNSGIWFVQRHGGQQMLMVYFGLVK